MHIGLDLDCVSSKGNVSRICGPCDKKAVSDCRRSRRGPAIHSILCRTRGESAVIVQQSIGAVSSKTSLLISFESLTPDINNEYFCSDRTVTSQWVSRSDSVVSSKFTCRSETDSGDSVPCVLWCFDIECQV